MSKKKNPKRKKKRNQEVYPNLKKGLNSRVRQEYLDMDYIDKLSPDEKAFLDKFAGEYYGGSFNKDGTDLTANDNEGYREAYDRNNARNRCLYGQVRNKVGATKLLNYDDVKNVVEEHMAKDINPNNIEDAIINYLDEKAVNSGSNSDDSGNDPDKS